MYTYVIYNLRKIVRMFECVSERSHICKKIAWERWNDTVLRNIIIDSPERFIAKSTGLFIMNCKYKIEIENR